jgi:molybdopterin/thiamine biosynthesis adenylyltransferase/molybdopterin synthase catalytic subunit
MFRISSEVINRQKLMQALTDDQSGGFVSFEGWVRNHNEGKLVSALEYEAFEELAAKEGQRICEEAKQKFNVRGVSCQHRVGFLKLGEIAVWIGASAAHRDDAFKAARYVIDEIKHRLPIWKKEHYVALEPKWVFCRDHHHHVHFHAEEFYAKQTKVVEQGTLQAASVLLIGAGGLGCPAATALAAAGVGNITLVDFDKISISNIHRQFLFSPNLVGEKKALVAKARLLEMNPFIKVQAVVDSFHAGNAADLLAGHNLVLDCTDNMESKFLIHDACLRAGVPLISASIYQHEGQIRTFDFEHGCLRCVAEKTPDDGLLGNCNDFGVLGAWVATLGSMQAAQAVEFLQHEKNSTTADTLYFDFKHLRGMSIKNARREGCQHCQGHFSLEEDHLELGAGELPSTDHLLVDIRNEADDAFLDRYLKESRKVVVCCHRGVRSKRLVKKLRGEGHNHFFSLRGGASSL